MPAVAQEVAQPRDGALVAHGLSGLRDRAGPQPRLPNGRAAPHRFLFGHREMEAQLLFDIGATIGQCSPDTEAPFPQPRSHFASSTSTACMMAAMRVHSAFSASRRRRPAAVML